MIFRNYIDFTIIQDFFRFLILNRLILNFLLVRYLPRKLVYICGDI